MRTPRKIRYQVCASEKNVWFASEQIENVAAKTGEKTKFSHHTKYASDLSQPLTTDNVLYREKKFYFITNTYIL